MRSLELMLAAAAAIAAPVAAQAEEARSVAVDIADLDLTSDAGVERLNRRIRGAADQVCGPMASRSITERSSANRCRKQAIAGVSGEVSGLVAAASRSNVRMAGRVTVRGK